MSKSVRFVHFMIMAFEVSHWRPVEGESDHSQANITISQANKRDGIKTTCERCYFLYSDFILDIKLFMFKNYANNQYDFDKVCVLKTIIAVRINNKL